MTNIIYFYNTLRSFYSSSSFSSVDCSEQASQHEETAVAEAEEEAAAEAEEEEACFARGRPLTQLQLQRQQEQEQDYDEATTKFLHAMHQQPAKTGEKKSRQKSASKFVSPTSQYSAFKRFDIVQLKAATRNFNPWPVSQSNYGLVREGWVDEHKLTATKPGTGIPISVIDLNCTEIFWDRTKSLEKLILLGRLHHPNLLRLLGYCSEDKDLLVYEFTSQGSLINLFGRLIIPGSQWLNVALDAAKGLAFIHSSDIVHGCFKSSNILLNSKYSAKLLGLDLPSPDSFFREMMETPIGDLSDPKFFENVYYASEHHYLGPSAKGDVYSFGVVLLEILYGRPAFQPDGPLAKWDLVKWIKSHGNLKSASVSIPCSHKCGEEAVRIALWCLNFRPTMNQVVEALEKLLMENNRHAL